MGKLKTPTTHDKRPAAHSENLNFVTKSVKFKSLTVDIDGKPALCTNLQFKHNGASAQECDRLMDTRQTNITLAHVNDAYSIATMSRDIIEHGLQWNWTPERIGRCILSPDINVVTAKDDSTVVGFGVMYYGYSKAHLNLLGVDASWRSLGIGNRLLMWLEQCAITAGIEHCQLEVRQSNDFARKFYSNHGYAEIEVVPGYYQRKEDAIRMSRCLQQPHLLK